MDSKETKVLTVNEVGQRLKVGRNTAYELFNQRDFPSFRIGKSLRITEAAFEEWLKNQVK
jgi:excisionase family DNA binding protein